MYPLIYRLVLSKSSSALSIISQEVSECSLDTILGSVKLYVMYK